MGLSYYALEHMGYQKIPEDFNIEGKFYAAHVYEVRGFTLNEQALEPVEGCVGGIPYKICFGAGVNDTFQRLCGDDFVDDEIRWKDERKCTPPYLVIFIKTKKSYKSTGRYFKEVNDSFETYNCFPEAKDTLREYASTVLPPVLSAMACTFASTDHPVSFVPLDKCVFGLTADGKTIKDILVAISGSAYTSLQFQKNQVESLTSKAVTKAEQINRKVAQFFNLGLYEPDLLKKFLFFFLSIEVQIHLTFKEIEKITAPADIPERIQASAGALLAKKDKEGKEDNRRALKDRLTWCALIFWTSLTDEDIEIFSRLKGTRDDIAHGSLAVPPPAQVVEVQTFATKLQTLT